MTRFSPFPAFKDHCLFKKHEAECLQNPALTDVVHVDILLQELLEVGTATFSSQRNSS